MKKTFKKEKLLKWSRINRQVLIGAVLFLAFIFPLFNLLGWMGMVWVRLGVKVAVFVLLALGLNIIIGETGLLNLGYIAFFAIGAYTTAIFASPRLGFHLPFWLLFLLSGFFAVAFGFLLGLPTLRLRGDYLAIVTLAFGEIVRITLNNWESVTNGPGGIPGIYDPVIFGLRIDNNFEYYYLTLGLIILCLILIRNLKNSRFGRAWNALREDEIAAECAGIHVSMAKLLSFMVSSLFAGFAGCIFASLQKFVNPQYFVFMQSVLVVCMVVLGGMGSIPGVIAGAIALDTLPEIIRHTFAFWLPSFLGEDFLTSFPPLLQNFLFDFDRYRMLIFGLAIVLMMIFRPEGLIPSRAWQRELHEIDPRLLEETQMIRFDLEEEEKDLEV